MQQPNRMLGTHTTPLLLPKQVAQLTTSSPLPMDDHPWHPRRHPSRCPTDDPQPRVRLASRQVVGVAGEIRRMRKAIAILI